MTTRLAVWAVILVLIAAFWTFTVTLIADSRGWHFVWDSGGDAAIGRYHRKVLEAHEHRHLNYPPASHEPAVRYCEVNADCHSLQHGVKWFGELKCEQGGHCVGSPLIGEHPHKVKPFTEAEWGYLSTVTVLGVCDTAKNRCER